MPISKRLLVVVLLTTLTYGYYMVVVLLGVLVCGADYRSLPYLRLGACALSAFLGGVLGTFLDPARDVTLTVLSLLFVAAALVAVWVLAAPMFGGILVVCLVLSAWKTHVLTRCAIIAPSNWARRRDELIEAFACVMELAVVICGLVFVP